MSKMIKKWLYGRRSFGSLQHFQNDFFNFFYNGLESEATAAQPLSDSLTNTSRVIETSTFFSVVNNTVLTEKSREHEQTQHSNTVNNTVILCIKIFGCVDILLICIYSAVCIYDRQHQTLEMVDTNESVPGNNSTYENAEIMFLSATGNQLL